MSFGIVTNVVLNSVATLLLLSFIVVASRRILGANLGIGRILFAGLLGLGAELGFESQVVWPSPSTNFALLPVQLGIPIFVTIAILVVLEIAVPQGQVPAVHQWGRSPTNRWPGVAATPSSCGSSPAMGSSPSGSRTAKARAQSAKGSDRR